MIGGPGEQDGSVTVVKLLVSVRPTVALKDYDALAQRMRDVGARIDSIFAPLGLVFVSAESIEIIPALQAIDGVKSVQERRRRS